MTSALQSQRVLDDAARRIQPVVEALIGLFTGDEDTEIFNGADFLPSIAKLIKDANDRVSSASGNVAFKDTFADAEATIGDFPDQQVIEVLADETVVGSPRTRYRIEAGILVLKANLDVLRQDLLSSMPGLGATSVWNATRNVANIAELISLPAPEPQIGRSYVAFVKEYFEGSVGGGGGIQWIPGSSATPDGWLVYAPMGHVGNGRWHRIGRQASVCRAAEAGIFNTGLETAPDSETYTAKIQRIQDIMGASQVGGKIELEPGFNPYVMRWSQRDGVFVVGHPDGSLVGLNKNRQVWVQVPASGGTIVEWPELESEAEGEATFGGGVTGIFFIGRGASIPAVGMRVRKARKPTVSGCHFDSFADEALIVEPTVRIPTVSKVLIVNALLNRVRAVQSFAFDFRGGDGVLDDIEAGPSLGALSSSARRVCAMRIGGDNNRWTDLIAEFGDIGIVFEGLLHHGGTARAEFSFAENVVVRAVASELGHVFSGVGSFGSNGSYDGIVFESSSANTRLANWRNHNDGRGNTRYGLRDDHNGDNDKNYLGTGFSGGDTIAPMTLLSSGAGFLQHSGDPFFLTQNSSTPVVLPWLLNYRTNNTVPTLVTAFAGSVPGMEVRVLSGGNITIQHNGVTFSLPGSVDLMLEVGRVYSFINVAGTFFLASSVS